jgi:hypothetical protein
MILYLPQENLRKYIISLKKTRYIFGYNIFQDFLEEGKEPFPKR